MDKFYLYKTAPELYVANFGVPNEIEIKSLISELRSYSLPTINEINQLTEDLYNKVMDFIKREEEEISRQ